MAEAERTDKVGRVLTISATRYNSDTNFQSATCVCGSATHKISHACGMVLFEHWLVESHDKFLKCLPRLSLVFRVAYSSCAEEELRVIVGTG